MTEPTDSTPTRTQTALGLSAVPARKYRRMWLRTLIGVLFMLALTAFLLILAWLKFKRDGEVSLALIGAGVFCGFVCGQIASGQVIGSAIVSLGEPLRLIRELVRGKDK